MSAFGCTWPSDAARGAPLQITQLLRRRRPVVPYILVTSSSRRVARGDEVITSAAAFLQSLLAEQPRSPAELRTDCMLPPSDFKAKDDIPHAHLSPGSRHHNRHFDYLLCHIIFHRSQSCQRNRQLWTSSQRQIYRDWLLLYMEVQKAILSCWGKKDSWDGKSSSSLIKS